MRCHDDSGASVRESADIFPHIFPCDRIESNRRLVEIQHVRLMEHSLSDLESPYTSPGLTEKEIELTAVNEPNLFVRSFTSRTSSVNSFQSFDGVSE